MSNDTLDVLKSLIPLHYTRENHQDTIACLSFNRDRSEDPAKNLCNLFVTVAKNQLNVYDNQHFSDYMDIFLTYMTPRDTKFDAVTWVSASDPNMEDTYIVVIDRYGKIDVISVARCRVVASLDGHLVPDLRALRSNNHHQCTST
jgi:hypothetical protein